MFSLFNLIAYSVDCRNRLAWNLEDQSGPGLTANFGGI